MSCKLREFIRNTRAAKTAADERAVVSKECAEIRTAFKEGDGRYRHRNVAKVLFISMLGYPTQFAQLECLKLLASPRFAEKRVGYLGLSCLLDEQSEVLMLATNSIKNDLQHPNQYVNGMALTALGNIGTSEMCAAIASQVEDLVRCSNPFIRKKAALCGVRLVKKVPDCEDKFAACLPALLADRNHGVLISACALLMALLERNPSLVESLRVHLPALVKSLKACLTAGYAHAAEYDIAGITDPFLQCKLLRVLAQLAKGNAAASSSLSDVLAHVATNTEGAKNVGNSVLYECVQTIMAIEDDPGLRVLGVNLLGRFLSSRELNVKYVALGTLQQVVKVDSKAVMRHRDTLLECLKDQDLSLRRRAVDVIFCLITDDNVRGLVKELLNFLLMLNDADFKQLVINKIAVATHRHAPTTRWQVDTLFKVMVLAGNSVDDAIIYSFVDLVVSTPPLHSYIVHKFFFSLQDNFATNAALWQAGLYCIGEFGDLLVKSDKQHLLGTSGSAGTVTMESLRIAPSQVTDLLFSLADQLSKFPEQKRILLTQTLLTAAAKLAARLPSEHDRLVGLLKKFESSSSEEVQQRSSEYINLLVTEEWRQNGTIFDRMPVSDSAKLASRRSLETLGDGFSSTSAILRPSRTTSTEDNSNSATPPPSRPVGEVCFDATDVPLDTGGLTASKRSGGSATAPAAAGESSERVDGDRQTAVHNGVSSGTHTKAPSSSQAGDLLDLVDLMGLESNSSSSALPQTATAGAAPKVQTSAPTKTDSIDILADLLGGTSISSTGTGPVPPVAVTNSTFDVISTNSSKAGGAGDSSGLDDVFGLSSSTSPVGPGAGISGEKAPGTPSTPFDDFVGDLTGSRNGGAGGRNGSGPSGMRILNEDDLCVDFVCSREQQGGNPMSATVKIRAEFGNQGEKDISNLLFEAAVPKYLKLSILPASGTSIPRKSKAAVTQEMHVVSCPESGVGGMGAKGKPLLMKCRISFTKDGVPQQKFVNVSDFPPGLL
ncbi:adaptin n terminal region domain-containing protein [Cystoisospora suis]|uniref:AP-1 complex subunit gamma n=1 Tax=Cystoisospora suis TaxID=483139 RepID=A0A2C6LFD5_9APIC|nr:adaptin n terminal region domain-containing protein [Cystoisospora suis]